MNIALILAGGKGTRMGMVDRPKQFLDIYGTPVLIHTLEAFEVHPEIDKICVVCLNDWHDQVKIWLRQYDIGKVYTLVDAGADRQGSSYNGLKNIEENFGKDNIVLIHDAARPMVSQRIISDNIAAAREYGACDTVIPTQDTIIRSEDGQMLSDIPLRSQLYLGQTPQSFQLDVIIRAHEEYLAKQDRPVVTDDCGLLVQQGKAIKLVDGDKLNLKITSFDDLLITKAIIRTSRMGNL